MSKKLATGVRQTLRMTWTRHRTGLACLLGALAFFYYVRQHAEALSPAELLISLALITALGFGIGGGDSFGDGDGDGGDGGGD